MPATAINDMVGGNELACISGIFDIRWNGENEEVYENYGIDLSPKEVSGGVDE